MFCKDTEERFIVMFTFSDGKQPVAQQSLKAANFKVNKYLKFNNSAIFKNSVDETTKMFFRLGY